MHPSSSSLLTVIFSALLIFTFLVILSVLTTFRFYEQKISHFTQEKTLIEYIKKEFNTSVSADFFSYSRRINNWIINASNIKVSNEYLDLSIKDFKLSFFFLDSLIPSNKEAISTLYANNAKVNLKTVEMLFLKEDDSTTENNTSVNEFQVNLYLFEKLPYIKKFLLFLLGGDKDTHTETGSLLALRKPMKINFQNFQIHTPNNVFFDVESATYNTVDNHESQLNFTLNKMVHSKEVYERISIKMSQKHNISMAETSQWNFHGKIKSINSSVPQNINVLTSLQFDGLLTIKPYAHTAITLEGDMIGNTRNKERYKAVGKAQLRVKGESSQLDLSLLDAKIDEYYLGNISSVIDFPNRILELSSSDFQLGVLSLIVPSIASELKIQNITGVVEKFLLQYNYDTGVLNTLSLEIPNANIHLDNPFVSNINQVALSYKQRFKDKKLTLSIPEVTVNVDEKNQHKNILVKKIVLNLDLFGEVDDLRAIKMTTSSVEISTNKFNITGHYDLKETQKNNLKVKVALKDATIQDIQELLNKIAEKDPAVEWVDNILSGEINHIIVDFEDKVAHLQKLQSPSRKIAISVKSNQVTLLPYKNWPLLKIQDIDVNYQNSQLLVKAKKAIAIRSKTEINTPKLVIDFNNHSNYLSLQGYLNTQKDQAINFVRYSPIPDIIDAKNFLDHLNINGNIKGEVKIKIPLSNTDERPVNIDVALNFEQALIEYKEWQIHNTKGRIHVNNYGINSSTITGSLSNQFPIQIKVLQANSAHKKQKASYSIEIPQTEKLIDFSSGNATFSGVMTFPNKNSDEFTYTLQSKLEDVSLELPSIFKKKRGEYKHFKAYVLQKNKVLHFDIKYDGHEIKASYDWLAHKIDPFLLKVGEMPQGHTDIKKGGYVRINIPYIDLEEWLKLSKYFNTDTQLPFSFPTIVFPDIQLKSDLFFWKNIFLHDAKVSINKPYSTIFEAQLTSKEMDIQLKNIENSKLSVDIKKLILPLISYKKIGEQSSQTLTTVEESTSSSKECFKFDDENHYLPVISITGSNIQYNNSSAIKVVAKGSLINQTLKFKTLSLHDKDTDFKINHLVYDSNKTSLQAHLKSKSITQLLSLLGLDYPEYVAENVKFNGNFSWKGAPWCVTTENLKGNLHAETGLGAVKGIQPGVGKLLSLLNLKILLKRFKESEEVRNKKDELEKQGMIFDKMVLNASLNDGISTIKHLGIDSSIAIIKMKGNIDFKTKKYDLMANVKPEIIPTLVTLTTLFSGPLGGLITLISSEILSILNLDDYLLTYNLAFKGDFNRMEALEADEVNFP